MRVQGYVKVAISLVIVIIVIVSLLAVNSSNTQSDTTGGVAVQPKTDAATATPVQPKAATATPVQPKADTATAAPKTAAPIIATVLPTSPVVIQGTASVSVGASQVISLPYFSALNLRAIKPISPPLHSADIALQTLKGDDDRWDFANSTASGKPITVTTTYVLLTEGQPGPVGGAGWNGSVNIHLRNCTVKRVCTDTGKVLDHLENRPMWLIDVEGISQAVGGPIPNTTPIPQNHIVYGIDDLDLDYFNFGGY